MKKLLLLFLVFPLFLAGCQLRDPLFDLATTRPEDVPRIITFDPADNLYDVPRNALIGMLFSKPMDEETLEDSFWYSYNNKTYGTSHGSFLWDSSGRFAVFRPYSFFPSSTEVSVTVGLYVKSKEGLNLEEGATWHFETSALMDFGPLYNITSRWASNETAVAGIHTLDAQIIIEFDKEMLRSSVEGSFQLVSDDFQDIRTVYDGYFLWSEPMLGIKRAIFTPNEPLMPGKRYQVYLNANGMQAVDVAGNSYNGLMLAPLFQFQTIDAIYVSTTGDDANVGYLSLFPLRTISRAMEVALEQRLPFIKIEDGIYNEDVVLSGPTYDGFVIQGGWTNFIPGPPVYNPPVTPSEINAVSNNFTFTLSNVDYVSLEGLKINGLNSGLPDVNGAVLINSGSTNIRIDTCDILGSADADTAYGIHITGGSNNVEVNNSTCEGALVIGVLNRAYGVSADNASNIRIWNNSLIAGRSGTVANAAVYIRNSSDVTIENNSIDSGWDGRIDGIRVENNSQNINIQWNWVTAGSTGNFPSAGIYVTGNSSVRIADNPDINGGTVSDNVTYGILVENGALANIYRNTIIGGNDGNPGGAPATHVGVGYSSAGNCNLFNNLIQGATSGTDPNNDCIGVSIQNSDISIINNSIRGITEPGNPLLSRAIYADNTTSTVINNIFIGRTGVAGTQRYGITLSDYNPLINDLLLYNNAFDSDGCSNGYLYDGITPYYLTLFPAPPLNLEALYNPGARIPSGNTEYLLGQVLYFTPTLAVNVGSPDLSSIVNNGYDVSGLLSASELQEASYDVFGAFRPPATTDRGGHEFFP